MENRMDDEEDVVFVRKNVSVLGEMGNRMGDENGVVFAKKAPNAQGMGNRRRALRDIKNFVDAPQMIKRVPQSKCSLDDKNATFVARRPITRKYAESLASKSQAHRQNARQKKQLIPGTCCPDDDKQISGSPLPMNVDHELKEVEMEDLPMDSLPDIDSCDSNDPLAAVEYVEDIYKFYRSSEVSSCVSPDYMSNQFDINDKMRSILVDWLIEVHYKFELMDETLYLTINTIDRFLEKQSIVRKKLQLVGVTAMLLACKYEEVSVPIIEDLVVITDRAYAREEIIEMEKQMANTLKFYMSVPTPYVFMKRFLKAAQASKRIELLSFFIMELSMVQYLMLKYRPSLLSAAAVYTAQCTIKGFRHWTRTCELHTTYAEHQLLECSRLMVALHQKASTGKLTVVHKKYSTSKFGCVALLVPALFLLN